MGRYDDILRHDDWSDERSQRERPSQHWDEALTTMVGGVVGCAVGDLYVESTVKS